MKAGFTAEKKQRYRCRFTACDKSHFLLDYSYRADIPNMLDFLKYDVDIKIEMQLFETPMINLCLYPSPLKRVGVGCAHCAQSQNASMLRGFTRLAQEGSFNDFRYIKI